MHQDLEIQIKELERFGVDELFREKASGKNITDRSEFRRLMDLIQPGDTVVVSIHYGRGMHI
ncbi:hypothetical protein JIR001_14230 [Polycladomyces abyssicola]|uniref:Resolvase/invertase-type recombinase catalytic domain-containing protein n=1 Tax=Polycladomyces abyssicola TaxID=1125966 RepID=A0A8D5UGR8_9BACL|nr:hypothetical protein JIR001_14230 [Polycladomyces abyssicola]